MQILAIFNHDLSDSKHLSGCRLVFDGKVYFLQSYTEIILK